MGADLGPQLDTAAAVAQRHAAQRGQRIEQVLNLSDQPGLGAGHYGQGINGREPVAERLDGCPDLVDQDTRLHCPDLQVEPGAAATDDR